MNVTMKNLIELQELMQRSKSQNHSESMRLEIERARAVLPEGVLRQLDHFTKFGRRAVAQLSESDACGSCHMKLPPADALHIRNSGHQLAICPLCGCFLYSPPLASDESKKTMETR